MKVQKYLSIAILVGYILIMICYISDLITGSYVHPAEVILMLLIWTVTGFNQGFVYGLLKGNNNERK